MYYYCLWVWAKIFGISEFGIRFLSVLFSSISVCLLYSFLKKHFNLVTAISAALLFSFHNFSYEYSHEARCYSLVVLLVLISTICFFNLIEKRTYLSIFYLGLVNFLIVYTHYIAGLVLVFQLIFLISLKEIY
ncbi:MAG: glycosyltransferase family 39 protein [Sphingobacteriaceae bacterium]|nr:glycosyltransferase family 39 protein [Sphingobacteriaceae bacterium]